LGPVEPAPSVGGVADISDGSVASWVQAGGVLAFASAVLWQLRDLKPLFSEIGRVIADVEKTLAALLERERIRHERQAAADAARVPADDEGLTPPLGVATRLSRAQSQPGTYGPFKPPREGR
jgi:hypothetical protein